MNESKDTAELKNESRDSKNNVNIKNTGEKKMDKTIKDTNVKINEIDDLLEENIVPNQNIITQYNRKKEEAKKLKSKLMRVAKEMKALGDKIKGVGGVL